MFLNDPVYANAHHDCGTDLVKFYLYLPLKLFSAVDQKKVVW